MPADNILLIAH